MENEQLLNGIVDIHLHVGPSLMAREMDITEAAKKVAEYKYKAIVHKDHHYCTAFLAEQVKKYVIPNVDTKVFGSICLNNSLGGVNARTVEAAVKSGAKVVWMPTTSGIMHIEHMKKVNAFPKLADGTRLIETPISIIEKGKLTKETLEVLEVIRSYPNVILASGHITSAEIYALVDGCRDMGIVDRLIIDHPSGIVEASLDDITLWAEKGATIEFVAEMTVGLKHQLIKAQDLLQQMKTVGIKQSIISSDAGAKGCGDIIETMDRFISLLLDNGFSRDDVRYMSSIKPSEMLGLS